MSESPAPTYFIHEAVAEDLRSGRFDHVRTRLPPEPNGCLRPMGHRVAHVQRYSGLPEVWGE